MYYGATGNYLNTEAPLLNTKRTTNGPTVILLEDTTIYATHEGTLDFPTLPLEARIAHVFPTLRKSLLSVTSIYVAGGTTIFESKEVNIKFGSKISLQGPRESSSLWEVTLSNSTKDNSPASKDMLILYP